MMRDRMNEQRIGDRSTLDVARAAAEAPRRSPSVAGRSSGLGGVHILDVRITDGDGAAQTAFFFGECVTVEIDVESDIEMDSLNVSFLVRDTTGIDLTGTTTFEEGVRLPAVTPGERFTVRFRFRNVFRHGGYGISAAVTRVTRKDLSDNVSFHQADAAAAFECIGRDERPVHYKFHLPAEIEIVTS
jgi:hypothetical protein